MATNDTTYVDPKTVENALRNPGYYPTAPTPTSTSFNNISTPPSTLSTSAIPADTLGAGTAIKVPTLNTDTSQADAMAEGAKSALDYFNESQKPETETSKTYTDLTSQINELLPGLGNKQTDQLDVEKGLGLPDLKKQLADINALITTRLADYNKQITAAEANAPGETPLSIVRGRQAVIQRNQAADIGLLQARALGLQGQVQAAQDTANRAIDLKYGAMEDEINVKMQQLELIRPLLSAEEERWASALDKKYEDDKQRIADQKAQQKAIQEIALNAAQYGASGAALDAIGKATNPMEAISLAGKYLAEPFNLQKQQLAVSRQNAFGNKSQIVELKDGTKAVVTYDYKGNVVNTQPIEANDNPDAVLGQARSQEAISTVTGLLSDKGLSATVGPIALARGGLKIFGIPVATTTTQYLTGEAQNFIASVEQLRSNLNLETLIDAKKKGATFGALSDQELNVLASAGTKIGSWAIKDKTGKVIGYSASEKDFKNELNKINNFAKLDFIIRGGDPQAVGVNIEEDGSLTTINWDGSVSQILK